MGQLFIIVGVVLVGYACAFVLGYYHGRATAKEDAHGV